MGSVVTSNRSDASGHVVDPGGSAAEVGREIWDWCLEALAVDGALVTVVGTGGGRVLLYASDTAAQELDDLQFSLGEGPCLSAFDDAHPVLPSSRTVSFVGCGGSRPSCRSGDTAGRSSG